MRHGQRPCHQRRRAFKSLPWFLPFASYSREQEARLPQYVVWAPLNCIQSMMVAIAQKLRMARRDVLWYYSQRCSVHRRNFTTQHWFRKRRNHLAGHDTSSRIYTLGRSCFHGNDFTVRGAMYKLMRTTWMYQLCVTKSEGRAWMAERRGCQIFVSNETIANYNKCKRALCKYGECVAIITVLAVVHTVLQYPLVVKVSHVS